MKKLLLIISFLAITFTSNAKIYNNVAVGFTGNGYINAVYQADFRGVELGGMFSYKPKYHTNDYLGLTGNVICGAYIDKGFSVGGLLGLNHRDKKVYNNDMFLHEQRLSIDIGAYTQYRISKMLFLQAGYTLKNSFFINFGVKF
jgi:hypothetical protein